MSNDDNAHGFGTRAIHGGQAPDPSTGAIMPPVYMTSTYVQSSPGVNKGFDYSRTINPTRVALERNLASLEGANHGLAFSSGMGAADCVLHLLDAAPPFAEWSDEGATVLQLAAEAGDLEIVELLLERGVDAAT